ncbi:RagB/SusD family nutrient uptake outer membrane protein [Prevotella aurantiaca]|uniref:RagB/SusD family nutrient uptake outer membrane protein n=1 Tax=Prevotella aurantiaca TaxID=596085 RepID=UPI001CB56294|nr:RagB/SusD family nutrient uptake outer membrane protein [Prevotella aurantiaca]MBF1386587.1 RagB/SusD family nutrient uptake outer membrane protein [Prevotella aurantiaca]
MKKYNKFLLVAGIGALSLTSCNLDVEPNDAVPGETTEALFTKKSIDYYLNGINQSYRSSFYGDLVYPAELMCDGFNATTIYGNNYGAVHRTDDGFTASDQNTIETWAQHYGALKNFNLFIEQIAKFQAKYNTDADALAKAKLYDGYAHFYRANAYLELVRHFAKAYNPSTASTDEAVPLVLEYNIEAKPARATVQAVYNQIKTDLDIAAAEIATKQISPVLGVTNANYKMTPTMDGVNALYARYYLDIQDYANAATYSKRVIDNAEFQLASTQDAFEAEYTYDKGTEAIMQLAGNVQEGGANTNSMFTRIAYNEGFKVAWNPEGYYYQPYYLPSQKLLSLYTAGDLRLKNWYAKDGIIMYIGGVTYNKIYLFKRYVGNPNLTTSMPNSRHLVKPFLLPEMYLINAEANAKAGHTADAVTILNQLQTARGAQTTGASIDEIGDEWFREMVGEGQRYLFLKRNHLGYSGRANQPAAANFVFTGAGFTDHSLQADSKYFTYPIPAREIKVNPNLTQNAGY